jgi:hypothetical protein
MMLLLLLLLLLLLSREKKMDQHRLQQVVEMEKATDILGLGYYDYGLMSM